MIDVFLHKHLNYHFNNHVLQHAHFGPFNSSWFYGDKDMS